MNKKIVAQLKLYKELLSSEASKRKSRVFDNYLQAKFEMLDEMIKELRDDN